MGEYVEALRIIRSTIHRTPRIHLSLAALYGHCGMPRESRSELALFQDWSPLPFEDVISAGMLPDDMRAWMLEGISRGREGEPEQCQIAPIATA